MPGRPSSIRSRSTGGVITPRSSAISGSAPSSRCAASNTAAPGPASPAARSRAAGARGHRPVGHEAAEVIDARQVGQLGGAPQALDPPAVAVAAQRAPVVERVAPELSGRAQGIGRGSRDEAALEDLGVGDVVGAAGADVERDVADQPDAARGRVAPQGAPLALEADLIGDRARAGEALPVVDPEGVRGAECGDFACAHRASGSASSPGQPANAELDVYGEPERSGGPSGSTCHQDWPGRGEPIGEPEGRVYRASRREAT